MVHEEDDETKLYSELVYDILNNGHEHENYEDLAKSLGTKLTESSTVNAWSTTLVNAWDLVSKIKKNDSSDDIICSWFYYWLGNKVHKGTYSGKFSDVMNNVYSALNEVLPGGYCRITETNVNKENFEEKMRMFEYRQDYEPKKEQLQIYHKFCDSGYRDEAKSTQTFSNVNLQCKNDANSKYCTKFEKTYEDYCKKEASSGLVCTPPPTAAASATTIVSSILGVVGLPTIAFFLYKVIIAADERTNNKIH
ncbi:Uncharacterized protein PCOAH_00000930 [Plasmodium coatneyi]|uniref:KIR protein n=1 Tax=Plasmodium coatneyi TaxID=208452 RepID=A0A1B1DSH1_9APIC|nr:Uncharacterized protein PCOAH_00000930 [Plasmodium coatneyi]ANQ05730.1 Uncharacterized protein PCOAH_00000930 [Plasmodium coatneyi]